jgi:D-proline reductase (dithiol) PrdB
MPLNLEKFKADYNRWVEESLPDYLAGKMESIVKKYPFITPEDIPWTPYTGTPAIQKFGIITSGGLYIQDTQDPFDTSSIHGDTSFRELPKAIQQEDIGIAHNHYDHSLAKQDVNIIFPIQRFIELEEENIIGRLADVNYSFSYVNDAVTLAEKTVPELIKRIRAQSIDVVFLVPV